jgi:Flp pilus assembly protein TadD
VTNRFRSPEPTINALGYRLLRERQVAHAVTVFELNTVVFPESSNVWDSYGEVLLEAGRRDAAIASYRRAVAIDRTNGSSLQALQRLGVSPHQ